MPSLTPNGISARSPSANPGSLLLNFPGILQELLSGFWFIMVTCGEKELLEAVNALRVTDGSTYISLGLLAEA